MVHGEGIAARYTSICFYSRGLLLLGLFEDRGSLVAWRAAGFGCLVVVDVQGLQRWRKMYGPKSSASAALKRHENKVFNTLCVVSSGCVGGCRPGDTRSQWTSGDAQTTWLMDSLYSFLKSHHSSVNELCQLPVGSCTTSAVLARPLPAVRLQTSLLLFYPTNYCVLWPASLLNVICVCESMVPSKWIWPLSC